MKLYLFLLISLLFTIAKCNYGPSIAPVNSYHFHTLFMQNNRAMAKEADQLRDDTINLIHQGYLRDCIVGRFIDFPAFEYPVGHFVTCCNATSMPEALPWFTQNRGQLSVFAHGCTRENLLDHKERGFWMGTAYPLDLSNTQVLLPAPNTCIPSQIV